MTGEAFQPGQTVEVVDASKGRNGSRPPFAQGDRLVVQVAKPDGGPIKLATLYGLWWPQRFRGAIT